MAFAAHYIDLAPRHSHLVILAFVATPIFLAPTPTAPFLAFVVVSTVLAFFELPSPANHMVLALLVNAALLAAAVSTMRRRPGKPQGTSRLDGGSADWLRVARAPAALTLLTVYGFAVLHKLNWSFFDPVVSCAGEISAQAIALTGLNIAIPGSVTIGLAIATLIVEALIPVLLVFASWRRFGILFGVAFHALLGAAGFVDFATFACAAYVLIAIDVVPLIRDGERHRRRAMFAWGAYLVCAALDALVVGSTGHHLPGRHQLLFVCWILGLIWLMTPLLKTMWAQAPRHEPPVWHMQSAWFAVIPLLALLNGMGPYLGFKTTSTFSMFSNLRTEEGRSNQMIRPLASLEVTPWMRDTVDVFAFELAIEPQLNLWGRLGGGYSSLWNGSRWIDTAGTTPVRVPWIELRRTVVRWKDAGVTGMSIGYRRHGVTRFVSDAVNDPELAAPLPWWTRWFVAFRDIETGNAVRCRW